MEAQFKKGDLVKIKLSGQDTLFLVYTSLDDCVKLCDCTTNKLYPAEKHSYIKKQSLVLISKGIVT